MEKLDNAKIFLIRKSIQRFPNKVTKQSMIPGIKDGLFKDIAKYVKKHNQMPTLEDIIARYRDSEYFVDTIKMVNITIDEMVDITKDLLGMNIEGYQEPERPSLPKVGRNDPCPCGSKLKYKKCCGK
jgi:uncharacterized protein YecA (UPF0149 family)